MTDAGAGSRPGAFTGETGCGGETGTGTWTRARIGSASEAIVDAGGLESLHLLGGRALSARDDRARVAHATAWRRRASSDEGDDGLLEVAGDPARRLFLGAAADLPDENDGFRLLIV